MKLIQSNYSIDRFWADTYMPSIEQLVRKVAYRIISFTIAPEQEDIERAIDYLITVETGAIACRIRRPSCNFRDFTIRSWRSSGVKTELEKIKEGFGKWYIYAWAKDKKNFDLAILVDLDKLRKSKLLENLQTTTNHDKKTGFVAISLTSLQNHGCIIEEIKNNDFGVF